MPRFIAIPVGQGDAFYLDRGNWSVLVDGGRAVNSFGMMFQTVTGVDSVSVLVCTHNDADHANGIIGFLRSGLSCNEVWLPGRWLDALPGVLRPFADVFVNLADEVEQVEIPEPSPSGGATLLERHAERYGDRQQEGEAGDEQPLGEDGWPESLREDLERAESWDSEGWPRFIRPDLRPYPVYRYIGMAPERIRLLWSAIDAASKIRAIAIASFHHGVPVRWFEYDVYRPGGGCIELQPLNARAIAQFRPFRGSLLQSLSLTVSNKESLVFWSPHTGNAPGVLFTADSDLGNVRLPPLGIGTIATVPHHGSEANANAYSALAACNPASLTWVRSDGRYLSRPGPSYLAAAGRRLCTICRQPGGKSSTKQRVSLFVRRGAWTRHPATRTCICA